MDRSQIPPLPWAQFSAATDPGRVRERNEDRILLQAWADGSALLAVVADGMGGHCSGDIAAQIAIDTFAELLEQPLPTEALQRYELLAERYQVAQERIRAEASQSFKLMDMGTTLVSALITPESYLYLHAGDCRFYHFDGEAQLVRRSEDHSVMQILLNLGKITEDQVATHPMRSVVNSCLGGRGNNPITLDPQWNEGEPPIYSLQSGDVLLLSSDGMHGAISSVALQQLVQDSLQNPEALIKTCIGSALEAGGEDNISAIAILIR